MDGIASHLETSNRHEIVATAAKGKLAPATTVAGWVRLRTTCENLTAVALKIRLLQNSLAREHKSVYT